VGDLTAAGGYLAPPSGKFSCRRRFRHWRREPIEDGLELNLARHEELPELSSLVVVAFALPEQALDLQREDVTGFPGLRKNLVSLREIRFEAIDLAIRGAKPAGEVEYPIPGTAEQLGLPRRELAFEAIEDGLGQVLNGLFEWQRRLLLSAHSPVQESGVIAIPPSTKA